MEHFSLAIKTASPGSGGEENTGAIYGQEPCRGNPDMAKILLAVVCIVPLAFLLCQARYCLSRCCNEAEVNHAGKQLTSRVAGPKYMPSSHRCKASSKGHESERSISPWRYEKDENNTRFPFRLWQARCNCARCIALKPSLVPGEQRNETNQHGNSVVVKYTTTVFFRRQCEMDPHQYTLVPELYTVNVSCTCVIPKEASRTTEAWRSG